jgi:hypothetical protein
MQLWVELLEQLAQDARAQAALGAIMWRKATQWPNGELVTQLACNRSALPGVAQLLDLHRVPVPANALTLIEQIADSVHARA